MIGLGGGTGVPSSSAFISAIRYAVCGDLVSIKRTDLAFGLRVVVPGEGFGIVDVSARHVAEHLCVQKTDAQAPSGGRIGARPCVTNGGESRDDGLTIDDKPSVPVENSRQQADGCDRLAVEPVGLQWARGDDAMECGRSHARPASPCSSTKYTR